jgi:hypothetical protein
MTGDGFRYQPGLPIDPIFLPSRQPIPGAAKFQSSGAPPIGLEVGLFTAASDAGILLMSPDATRKIQPTFTSAADATLNDPLSSLIDDFPSI